MLQNIYPDLFNKTHFKAASSFYLKLQGIYSLHFNIDLEDSLNQKDKDQKKLEEMNKANRNRAKSGNKQKS